VSKSRKKTAATRGKRARPRGAKRARLKPPRIELKPIRTRLKANVNALSASIAKSPDAKPELEEALKRMSRFLADIQDICGPDMMIPLP
jgi:hypothetical protein